MRCRLLQVLCCAVLPVILDTGALNALPPIAGPRAFVIQVLDEENRPIVGAFANARPTGAAMPAWQGKTDKTGTAVWNEARGKVVRFSIGCQGYVTVQAEVNTSEPFQVVLKKTPVVRGRVIDDLLGEPVVGYSVFMSRVGSDMRLPMRHAGTKPDGTFTWPVIITSLPNAMMVVSAPGYESWSAPIDEKLFQNEVVIRLKVVKAFRGTILTPDGKPAKFADVMLLDLSKRVSLSLVARTSRYSSGPPSAKSDAEGRFVLELHNGVIAKPTLCVEHTSGYAQVTLATLGEPVSVTLKPWANLEIVVTRGGKPASNLPLTLTYKRTANIITPSPISLQTDSKGHVLVEKLFPLVVEVAIGDRGNSYSGKPSRSQSMVRDSEFVLTEGHNDWAITLDGVKLVGKVVIPPDPQGHRSTQKASIDVMIMSSEIRAGNAISVAATDDGSFTVESIPPGKYILYAAIRFQPDSGHSPVFSGLSDTPLKTSIKVAKDQHEPIDVVLEYEWTRILDVGDDAMPFIGRTIEGQVIESKAFVGKWLVMHWHAENSDACNQHLTSLLSSYPNWNQSGIEVVGISANQRFLLFRSEPRQANVRPPVPWAFIEDNVTDALLSRQYNVQSAPTVFLIDPNGKIVYRGSDVAALKKMIVELVLVPKQEIAIATTHPFAPVKSLPPDNEGDEAAVALQVDFENAESVEELTSVEHEPELHMFTQQGKLVRKVSLGKRTGYSKQTVTAVDRKRRRMFASTASGVVALSRHGEMLFKTPLPGILNLCVDEATGDLWCGCGERSLGWVVVLDSDGNELRRMVVPGNDLRYNATTDTFWAFQNTSFLSNVTGDIAWLTIVDRQGKVLRTSTERRGMSYFGDCLFDSKGNLWCIATSPNPDGRKHSIGSLTLQMYDGNKFEEFATDGRPSAVEAVGDSILVSVPKSHLERFSLDGKRIERLDDASIRLFSAADSGVWSWNQTQVEHYSSDLKLLGSFTCAIENTGADEKSAPVVKSILAF